MTESIDSGLDRGRILVADDEPHIRRVLGTILESAGFRVDTVSDGSAALELLRGGVRYDLALLDLLMPDMEGLEVLDEARRLHHRKDLPVVILTAKGQDQDRDRLFRLGAVDLFTKPFSPKKLLGRVEELAGPPPEEGGAEVREDGGNGAEDGHDGQGPTHG